MKKSLLAFLVFGAAALQAQTPRMCLYEEFTGETCPPCASTNPGLNKILLSPTNANKVIPIKWQVPIPSAPSNTWSLYQTNKTEINWRYRSIAAGGYGYISQNSAASGTSSGINSAPQGVMDGQHVWLFGAASNHPANLNNAVIATAQSYTSAFSVDMRHEWDATMSAINLTVNITASANFTAVGPLVFRCVMVERLIQFSVQPGTNGEKIFEDVAIRSYPTLQNGTSMVSNWTTGQNQTFTLSCVPPSYTRRLDQISLVGFIQDDGNRKVAQACRSKALYDAELVDAKIAPACNTNFAPQVNVQNQGLEAITSLTITPFVDGTPGASSTWTGLLAPGSNTSIILGSLTTPNGNGPHTFSVTITGMNGTDFNPNNNSVSQNFPVYSGLAGGGVAEDFSVVSFPPTGWTNVNYDGGFAFERTNAAGAYWQAPFGCMKYNLFENAEIGDIDEAYLPAMDLRGGDNIDMSFDYAYAQKSAANNDKLEVFVSSDCGANWLSVFSKSGAALSTCSSYTAGGPYIPDQNEFTQWTNVVVALPGMNQASVIAKFVVTNDNGNNLYIDNVNIVQHSPSGIASIGAAANTIALFPNPASNKLAVSFNAENNLPATIEIFTLSGQLVLQNQVESTLGENSATVDISKLTSGLYLVKVAQGNQHFSTKLEVSK